MLRKAKIQDVKSIHEILTHYANQSLLLPRSLIELYDHLRDFYVIENIKVKGSLLGVCSIGIPWEDLGEIRSLAVVEEDQSFLIVMRLQ